MERKPLLLEDRLAYPYQGVHRWLLEAEQHSMPCPFGLVDRATMDCVNYTDNGGLAENKGQACCCNACGRFSCVLLIDSVDCLWLGFRTKVGDGNTHAFVNPNHILSANGFSTAGSDSVDRVAKLVHLLAETDISGTNLRFLLDQLNIIVGGWSGDPAPLLPHLRTCLARLDTAAEDPGGDILLLDVDLFRWLAHYSPREAQEWVGKWRNCANPWVRKYIVAKWSSL